MRTLVVESLSIRGFRNLASVDIELGPRFNVLSGDNGQGKTNLIECAYVLATSRSFRTSRLADLVGRDAELASVRGHIVEGQETREQSIGLRGGLRSVRIDGKKPATLASYAVHTPTVVFHPGAVSLASGSGSERRKLLDRVALYLFPASLVEADHYARAVRGRQRALELRGDQARDLDGWEDLMAKHGAALHAARAAAVEALAPAAMRAFARIGPDTLALHVVYAPGSPSSPEAFRAALQQSRLRDRSRGSATWGPHRDDLSLQLADRPVRAMASQGQQRAVVLALELAEIEVVAAARGVQPILLLDDVSSELDRTRMLAFLTSLRDSDGQVWLTTTRPELLEFGGESGSSGSEERRDFRVTAGRVLRV